jgi:hypothetical protein
MATTDQESRWMSADAAAARRRDWRDDDLTVLDLWEAVMEEVGERSLGELEFDATGDARTLGALARAFHDPRDRRRSSHGSTASTKVRER